MSDQSGLLTREVPANGQLVAGYSCKQDEPPPPCDMPESIEIFDPEGQAVAGEVTRTLFDGRRAEYTFQPAAPLTVGASYRVHWSKEGVYEPSFTVVPAVTLDPELVSVEPELEAQARPLRSVCCDESKDSCGNPLCVGLEYDYSAALVLGLSVDPSQYWQWRWRVHGWDANGAETVSAWGESKLQFSEQRAEYCIQGELQSRVDGSTYLLEKHCLPHGDLPDFGVRPVEPAQLAELISQCDYPRPGTEEAWCAGTAERCEGGYARRGICESRPQYCANDASSDVATSDVATSDVAFAGSDAGASDTAGGGCALGFPERVRSGAVLGFVLAAIAGRRRRSRDSRR